MSIPFLLVTSKEKSINPLRLKVYQFRICEHKVKRPLYFSLHETFFPRQFQTITTRHKQRSAISHPILMKNQHHQQQKRFIVFYLLLHGHVFKSIQRIYRRLL